MAKVTVGRWGNNLAVRLPGEIVDAIKLRDGEQVEIEAHDGEVMIRRVRQRVSLEDLFRGRSPDEWRSDYAGAYDWGGRSWPGNHSGMTGGHIPSAVDLIWTDFDPTRGRQQAGRRPALVISAAAFTDYTGLTVVCPITSRVRLRSRPAWCYQQACRSPARS